MWKRDKKWVRRLGLLAVAGLTTFPFAWIVLLSLVERTEPFAGASQPACTVVANERYESAIQKARIQIQAMMVERMIPGLTVAAAFEGRIIWSEGFGYADLDKKILASPTTQFRIASVSKLLTAAGAMRLYEQGNLDLDAAIQTYVPGFPDKRHTLSIRQLLSHRAGIRHYRDDYEAINKRAFETALESLETFKDDPLMFVPDSDFGYSSYGFVLVSAAIERVTGKDFPSAIRSLVFEPLYLSNTLEERVHRPAPCQATFYDNETPFSTDGTVVISPYNDFSSKWAAGGFVSTAEDLALFGSAHIDPINAGFLSPSTIHLLFAPRTRQAVIMGCGLGWMSATDLHLRQVGFHFGAGSGGTSLLTIYPGERFALAILTNLGHAKFPPERLFGIVNPFLSDPAVPAIGGLLVLDAVVILFFVRRKLRRKNPVQADETGRRFEH